MKTKYTPGPWMTVKINEDIHAFSINCVNDPIGTKALDICAVWMRGGMSKAEANANLIAAAPELLAALRDLLRIYVDDDVDDREYDESTPNQWHDEQCEEAAAKARAAIAKATCGEAK